MLDAAVWITVHHEAQAMFPGVALDDARFLAHVAALPSRPPPKPTHGHDLWLACACVARDQTALQIVERDCFHPARTAVSRFDADDDFVAEVLQELRARLLLGTAPAIATYAAQGPLIAWIRVSASRAAIDQLRARRAGAGRGALVEDPLRKADLGPEVELLRRYYGQAFRAALHASLEQLTPRDRTMLRRHLVEGSTLTEIAAPYRIHPATVARRLETLRGQIAAAVRGRLLALTPEPGAPSWESLAGAIQSEVYLSLSPLLSSEGREAP
jgi:RNA polymerase sigma-70 factor, ECF subfamily